MRSILIIVLVAISTFSFAQTQKKTYGPKAKNQRIWINKSNKSELQTNDNEKVTGGKAKNNQVWAKNYNASETTKVTNDEDKMALKGPEAKNYKPYQNKKQVNTDSIPDTNLVQSKDKKTESTNNNTLDE